MSRSDEDGRRRSDEERIEIEPEDPFWEIALNYDAAYGGDRARPYRYDGSDRDGASAGGKVTNYSLPNCSVTLELARLPPEDGVWSPVGDHAWYSSALLASLILQGNSNNNNNKDIINPLDKSNSKSNSESESFRVLELGSGAVGLSGLSFAVALSLQRERFPSWTVTLTDNDASLLKQLETNVRSNQQKHRERLLSADVVIGSELAYTHETATALVTVLLALLDQNPAVQIWIVQVTDRYGWSEIVLPALEARRRRSETTGVESEMESEIEIEIESIPLTLDVHETASTMIPMGGALDRFAFGAFRIANKNRDANAHANATQAEAETIDR
eukprot:jgi/Psemu1/239981/estExt_Genewise1.C_1650036